MAVIWMINIQFLAGAVIFLVTTKLPVELIPQSLFPGEKWLMLS
jgi:hypothetical protein